MSDFIEQEIIRIRKLVGDKAQVIGAVSGGVDSSELRAIFHFLIFKLKTCLKRHVSGAIAHEL